jgi:hypothetical protein
MEPERHSRVLLWGIHRLFENLVTGEKFSSNFPRRKGTPLAELTAKISNSI